MSENHKFSYKKIITLIVKMLFAVIFVFVLILFVQMSKHPNQPPHIFGYQGLTVLSNSMNPTFATGDLVIVKTMGASDVQKNDIITFKANDTPYITHRVVDTIKEKGETSFVTKGDNNNVIDEEIVHADHLVGKVLFHIPKLGYIANFVISKTGFVLLIIIPLIGYVSLELYERIGKHDNKNEGKKIV